MAVSTNNGNVYTYKAGNDLLLYSYTPVTNVTLTLNKNTIHPIAQAQMTMTGTNNQPSWVEQKSLIS